MPIAFDAASGGTSVGSTSETFSHTCTGSNLALFVAITANDGTVTGVTYNSISMTQVGSEGLGVGSVVVYLYQLLAPATGANNVVISRSGSLGALRGSSASYTGVKQSSQPDNFTVNLSGSTPINTTLTTVANSCWTVMAVEVANTPLAASTGSTQRHAENTENGIFDSNGLITPAGSTTMSVTAGAGNTATVMASFAPFVYSFSIADTVTETEAKTMTRGASFTKTETVSLTESFTKQKTGIFSILETVSLSEVFILGAVWIKTLLSSSSWTNGTKNSSAMAQPSKSSTSWLDKNKS